MNFYFQLFFLFCAVLISSIILIRFLIKYLIKIGIVDAPNERKVHKKVTPRGGGIVAILALIIGGSFFEYISSSSFYYSIKIIPVLTVISIISLIDDIKNISISLRLFTHLFSATIIIFSILFPNCLFQHKIPMLVDLIISIVGLTAFLNIYNFLDGVDGITAAQTIHLTITMLILCYLKQDVIEKVDLIVVICIILNAFSFGFLLFNWHPASIFIGDVGTIGIGLMIGLCLLLIASSQWQLFIASIISCLYYLADGGMTILIRLFKGEKIWQPHLQHFFQQAMKKGMTHRQIVMRIAICNLLLMGFSIGALLSPTIYMILAIITVSLTLMNFAK